MAFPSDSAGGVMTPAFVAVDPGLRADQAIAALRRVAEEAWLQIAEADLDALGFRPGIDGVGCIGARRSRAFDEHLGVFTRLFDWKHAKRLAAGKADDQQPQENEEAGCPVRP